MTKALHSPNSLVGLQLPVTVYSTRVYSCRWQCAIENNQEQAQSHKASWLTFLLTAQILSHSIMTTERDEPCTHQHFRQDSFDERKRGQGKYSRPPWRTLQTLTMDPSPFTPCSTSSEQKKCSVNPWWAVLVKHTMTILKRYCAPPVLLFVSPGVHRILPTS